MTVNKIITDAFDCKDDTPKEICELILRFLEWEDKKDVKPDAIASLLEQRIKDKGLVKNEKVVEWCKEYAG